MRKIFLFILVFLIASPCFAATVTKTIGSGGGRDYSTISAWEADLDDSGIYSDGDDAVGECYNDSAFEWGSTLDIDEGDDIGGVGDTLASLTLTAASGEQHDGTAGTGVRIVATSDSNQLVWSTGASVWGSGELSNIEFDWSGYNPGLDNAIIGESTNHQEVDYERLLVHDATNANRVRGLRLTRYTHSHILNCIVYDMIATGTSYAYAYGIEGWVSEYADTPLIQNCTVYKIESEHDDSPNAIGITFADDAKVSVQNNIAVGVTSNHGTATAQCFNPSSPSNATADYNLSSDTTAPGGNSLTEKTAGNQFVSTTDGSEDLHLKSGADAIDAGTDLGDVDAAIDIDGRNRHDEGDTWDIGADEYVAAVTAVLPQLISNVF